MLLVNKSLEKIRFLFTCTGMNMDKRIMNFRDVLKFRTYYIFNFIGIFLSAVIMIWYMIELFILGNNFVEVTSCAPCLMFTVLALFKSAIHYSNEDKIFNLLEILRKMEENAFANDLNQARKAIFDKDISFLNYVLNLLYFMNYSMMITFDFLPLIFATLEFYKASASTFDMVLPYMDLFVLVEKSYLNWVLLYLYEIWEEAVVLMSIGAADYLFFTCCTFIRIQFKLLKVDFEQLVCEDEGQFEEMESTGEFHEKFCRLVKWHQDLIKSAALLELIYSKSNLFNFLSSSLVICLTSFNVTQSDESALQIKFLTFFFMGMMQVFFVCLFADLLMDASMDIGNAVYNSRWYITRAGSGKDLLQVITRARVPCKLTAYGFADVNLRAFTRVLSTSWSYFALLQTIYEA